MPEVLYYVVGFAEDTRHAVAADPYQWVRRHPGVPMHALCGNEVLVALPGTGRPPPAIRAVDGSDTFCAICTTYDAASPARQRVFTAQSWRTQEALARQRGTGAR